MGISDISARTTGLNASIRFLNDVFLELAGDQPRIVEKSEFAEVFKQIFIDEGELTKDKYVPRSSGQGQLYNDLREGLLVWKRLT